MKIARISVQLTPEEKKLLLEEAERTGFTMSTLIRLRIMDIIRPEEESK